MNRRGLDTDILHLFGNRQELERIPIGVCKVPGLP